MNETSLKAYQIITKLVETLDEIAHLCLSWMMLLDSKVVLADKIVKVKNIEQWKTYQYNIE